MSTREDEPLSDEEIDCERSTYVLDRQQYTTTRWLATIDALRTRLAEAHRIAQIEGRTYSQMIDDGHVKLADANEKVRTLEAKLAEVEAERDKWKDRYLQLRKATPSLCTLEAFGVMQAKLAEAERVIRAAGVLYDSTGRGKAVTAARRHVLPAVAELYDAVAAYRDTAQPRGDDK